MITLSSSRFAYCIVLVILFVVSTTTGPIGGGWTSSLFLLRRSSSHHHHTSFVDAAPQNETFSGFPPFQGDFVRTVTLERQAPWSCRLLVDGVTITGLTRFIVAIGNGCDVIVRNCHFATSLVIVIKNAAQSTSDIRIIVSNNTFSVTSTTLTATMSVLRIGPDPRSMPTGAFPAVTGSRSGVYISDNRFVLQKVTNSAPASGGVSLIQLDDAVSMFREVNLSSGVIHIAGGPSATRTATWFAVRMAVSNKWVQNNMKFNMSDWVLRIEQGCFFFSGVWIAPDCGTQPCAGLYSLKSIHVEGNKLVAGGVGGATAASPSPAADTAAKLRIVSIAPALQLRFQGPGAELRFIRNSIDCTAQAATTYAVIFRAHSLEMDAADSGVVAEHNVLSLGPSTSGMVASIVGLYTDKPVAKNLLIPNVIIRNNVISAVAAAAPSSTSSSSTAVSGHFSFIALTGVNNNNAAGTAGANGGVQVVGNRMMLNYLVTVAAVQNSHTIADCVCVGVPRRDGDADKLRPGNVQSTVPTLSTLLIEGNSIAATFDGAAIAVSGGWKPLTIATFLYVDDTFASRAPGGVVAIRNNTLTGNASVASQSISNPETAVASNSLSAVCYWCDTDTATGAGSSNSKNVNWAVSVADNTITLLSLRIATASLLRATTDGYVPTTSLLTNTLVGSTLNLPKDDAANNIVAYGRNFSQAIASSSSSSSTQGGAAVQILGQVSSTTAFKLSYYDAQHRFSSCNRIKRIATDPQQPSSTDATSYFLRSADVSAAIAGAEVIATNDACGVVATTPTSSVGGSNDNNNSATTTTTTIIVTTNQQPTPAPPPQPPRTKTPTKSKSISPIPVDPPYTPLGMSAAAQESALVTAQVSGVVAGAVVGPGLAMSVARGMSVFQLVGCPARSPDGTPWSEAVISFPQSFLPGVSIGDARGGYARASIISLVVLLVLAALLGLLIGYHHHYRLGSCVTCQWELSWRWWANLAGVSPIPHFFGLALAQLCGFWARSMGVLIGAVDRPSFLLDVVVLCIAPAAVVLYVGGRYYLFQFRDIVTSSAGSHTFGVVPSTACEDPAKARERYAGKKSGGVGPQTVPKWKQRVIRFLNSALGRFALIGDVCWESTVTGSRSRVLLERSSCLIAKLLGRERQVDVHAEQRQHSNHHNHNNQQHVAVGSSSPVVIRRASPYSVILPAVGGGIIRRPAPVPTTVADGGPSSPTAAAGGGSFSPREEGEETQQRETGGATTEEDTHQPPKAEEEGEINTTDDTSNNNNTPAEHDESSNEHQNEQQQEGEHQGQNMAETSSEETQKLLPPPTPVQQQEQQEEKMKDGVTEGGEGGGGSPDNKQQQNDATKSNSSRSPSPAAPSNNKNLLSSKKNTKTTEKTNNAINLRVTLAAARLSVTPHTYFISIVITALVCALVGVAQTQPDMCPDILGFLAFVNTLAFLLEVALRPSVITLTNIAACLVDAATMIATIMAAEASLRGVTTREQRSATAQAVQLISAVTLTVAALLLVCTRCLRFVALKLCGAVVMPLHKYERLMLEELAHNQRLAREAQHSAAGSSSPLRSPGSPLQSPIHRPIRFAPPMFDDDDDDGSNQARATAATALSEPLLLPSAAITNNNSSSRPSVVPFPSLQDDDDDQNENNHFSSLSSAPAFELSEIPARQSSATNNNNGGKGGDELSEWERRFSAIDQALRNTHMTNDEDSHAQFRQHLDDLFHV